VETTSFQEFTARVAAAAKEGRRVVLGADGRAYLEDGVEDGGEGAECEASE
jgi:hypothetical protein